jgi:hypothetical protein
MRSQFFAKLIARLNRRDIKRIEQSQTNTLLILSIRSKEMISNEIKIEVPADIMKNWQEISDILAGMIKIPAALIMRFTEPEIEVFVSSNSEGNPYHPGDKEKLHGSGLYCETVIKTKNC